MINTNKTSEDELRNELERLYKCVVYDLIDDVDRKELWITEVGVVVQTIIRTEKLKLLDKFENDCKYNYTTFGNSEKMLQVSGLLKRIKAERTKLEAEL